MNARRIRRLPSETLGRFVLLAYLRMLLASPGLWIVGAGAWILVLMPASWGEGRGARLSAGSGGEAGRRGGFVERTQRRGGIVGSADRPARAATGCLAGRGGWR